MKRLAALMGEAMRLVAGCGGAKVVMVSTFQLKEKLANLEAVMAEDKKAIMEVVDNPKTTAEQLEKYEQRKTEMESRIKILKEEIASQEASEKARIQAQAEKGAPQMSKEEARGRFFKAVLVGGDLRTLPKMVYEQLGAIPKESEDHGFGSNLLPASLASEILSDPLISNPLSPFMRRTSVPGLEIARLDFVVEDDSFVAKDGETAKELKAKGDKISFGNFKAMYKAKVSESILRSSYLDVNATVTDGLESAQAAKELNCIFAKSPKSGEEHMSLYSVQNAIKEVSGKTMFEALVAAYSDLEDAYAAGAIIVMNRKDYFTMVPKLANGAADLFGEKPAQVLGIPVVFCEKAEQPVVGNFKFLHLNYNAEPLYDTDKDVDSGTRLFVLTHWLDIRVKLASAFRRVKVQPGG